MKTAIRNPQSAIRPWGSWLIFLLLCGHVIFCHGCHGEDGDDELCVPPTSAAQETRSSKTEIRKKTRNDISGFFRISVFEFL